MADMIKFYKGAVASLPTTGVNGALYVTTDEGGIYLGTGTGMKRLGDFVQVDAVANLPAKAHEGCLYYCVAENILAKWNGTEWKQINKQPTAEELKTLLGLGSMAYVSTVVEDNLSAELKEKINASAEGNHAHSNKAELDKIADGDVAKWNAAEQNAKDHADTELAKKVDKVEGKSLVADTEITKLAGVSEGANKVEASETNGNIKIDGVETTVYTHPAKHNITDIEGLQDALDSKQGVGDYAAEDHKHVKADITDFEHTHASSEITDLDATIKGYDYATKAEAEGYANAKDDAIAAAKKAGDDAAAALNEHITEAGNTYETKTDAASKLAEAKKYTEDKIAEIPAQTDYTVTITETTDGLDASVAKKYTFTQNGAEIGSINLAKELVVTSGSVKEVAEADKPYAGAVVGDKYIELVIANQDAPIYVPAKDLVDIYTAKDGAAEVQVAISNTNEISATLVNGGVTEEKLAESVKTKLNKTWEEVGVAQGLVDELANGQVKTNKEAIDAINNESTGILKQAKDYADGLADNYAAAEHDHVVADITDFDAKVKEYGYATTDEVASAKGEAISAAETKAGELDAALKTELQGEIDADVKVISDALAEYKTANNAEVAKKANSADVYAKTETYTKDEVNALLTWGEF